MAQFYASIQGNRGETTRIGSKESGIQGNIRGWNIGAKVYVEFDKELQTDRVTIYRTGGSHQKIREVCIADFTKDKDLLKED